MASDNIDWAGIRAAAVAVGIREACRQATAHLPPDEANTFTERAMKRCSRQGWLTKAEEAKTVAISKAPTTLSANVRTGAQVVADSLAEDSRETKLSLSRSARRMAQQAESAKLEEAADVLQVGKLAALTHGWGQSDGNTQGAVINVNLIGMRLADAPAQEPPTYDT